MAEMGRKLMILMLKWEKVLMDKWKILIGPGVLEDSIFNLVLGT